MLVKTKQRYCTEHIISNYNHKTPISLTCVNFPDICQVCVSQQP